MTKHRIEELKSVLKTADANHITSIIQLMVFMSIADTPEMLTAKEVAELTGITPPQVASTFRTLESRGMATVFPKTCAKTNRKNLVIDMTGKGRALAVKMGIN